MMMELKKLLDGILAPTIGLLYCVTRFRLIDSGTRLHSLATKPGCDHVFSLLELEWSISDSLNAKLVKDNLLKIGY